MKTNRSFYQFVKQVHLYTSLLTVVMLLMYILTSYMMIYHDLFKVEKLNESSSTKLVQPEEISDANWPQFLKKHNIEGRLVRENFRESGDIVRTYASANGNSKITILNDKDEVEIVTTQLNLSGSIIGLHRLRGYGGSLIYNIYAFMLDIVGIGLILFAITGVILWLKLLKKDKIAWLMLILGFLYVSAVIGYLSFN